MRSGSLLRSSEQAGLRPRRRLEVLPSQQHRFVAASDAAEDVPGEGTGGFLLVWRAGLPEREAFVAEVSPSVYSLFTPGDHKIAQLELSMVLYALTARASRFRGARGVWYIDNVAALRASSVVVATPRFGAHGQPHSCCPFLAPDLDIIGSGFALTLIGRMPSAG